MSTQEIRHSGGFLPSVTTFSDQQHHESPPFSSTTDHLHGFTRIPLPINFHVPSPLPTPNLNNNRSDRQENPPTNTSAPRIAAVPRRAVSDVNSPSFQEALAAATTTTTYPLRRTMSDISSSAFQEALTTTTTQPRRAPAPSLPVARTSSPPPNARRRRRTAAEAPNRRERLQSKRSKKVAEMMREIEQKCREVMRESEQEQEHLQHASSEFNNPSQEEEGGVRVEEVESELVSDNFLKIKLKCSCGKGYQFLCKGHTCFYRLA